MPRFIDFFYVAENFTFLFLSLHAEKLLNILGQNFRFNYLKMMKSQVELNVYILYICDKKRYLEYMS